MKASEDGLSQRTYDISQRTLNAKGAYMEAAEDGCAWVVAAVKVSDRLLVELGDTFVSCVCSCG